MLSPIILFVYDRPEHTRQTLEALAVNTLAQESELIVYADGVKDGASEGQIEKIWRTREVVRSRQWCKNVTVIESDRNKGLAASIIFGVTETVNLYGTVIVLEDDIVTGRHFLEYMNAALRKYKDKRQVWHITGWRDPVRKAKEGGSYFYPTMDCWGWATWADRWRYFKKDAAYYQSTFTDEMKFHFNIEGSEEGMWGQIEDNISGRLDTWAIFWYATIFLNGAGRGLCLAPTRSLVRNIGLDNSGEHCGKDSMRVIKDSIDFRGEHFPDELRVDQSEYEKNIRFLFDRRRVLPSRKCTNMIKRIIKKPLRPVYHAIKRLCAKMNGGGYCVTRNSNSAIISISCSRLHCVFVREAA